jgi:hypothetical protein
MMPHLQHRDVFGQGVTSKRSIGVHIASAAAARLTSPPANQARRCLTPEKGRSANKQSSANSAGMSHAGHARRTNDGVIGMATTRLTARTKVVSPPVTEREVAERFAAVIIRFEVGELAQGANATKEAGKKWKAARSCPNLAKTINMARSIPSIGGWVIGEVMGDPQAINAVIAGLQYVSSQPGPEGSAARAILTRLLRGE